MQIIRRMTFSMVPGVRNSLFVSGCSHKCKGCFNSPAWNPNFGQLYTKETEEMIISDLKNPHVSGLSLLGGEPFDSVFTLLKLIKKVKSKCPDKDIWCWSGYTFDQLLNDQEKREMLSYIDVLIDGKFEIDKKDLKLKFRGSSNQRIINVQESLKSKELILLS